MSRYDLATFFSHVFVYQMLSVVKKGGGLNAIFDSQTENFLSQRVQSTNSTEAEFCWFSTQ